MLLALLHYMDPYISCSCNQPDDVVSCCSDATVVHRVHHDVVQRDEMV